MQRRAYAALVVLLVIALIVGGVTLLKNQGTAGLIPDMGITLTASQADAAGIHPGTAFQLASAAPLSLTQVKEHLTVTPAVALHYEQTDTEGRLFAIRPAVALDSNKVYSFRLTAAESTERPYQWSFQTKAEFRVLGTLPRHQSTGVPVQTGIEITFSHEHYSDPAALFSIMPKVEGRFERHKKTFVFVPKGGLAPGTVYTVTLKPGLTLDGTDTKLTEEVRFSFETAPADDPNAKVVGFFSVGREVQEFPAGETPYFPVQYYSRDGRTEVTVNATIYKYQNAQRFITALEQVDQLPWWAEYTASKLKEETSLLSRVARFDSPLKQMPGHHTPYLFLPEPLTPGYYLAELKIEEQSRQVRFQVSDLASHLSVTSTQSLIWINDVVTGAPVNSATITHPGGKVTTGPDGLATFPTPATFGHAGESVGLYLQIQAGGKEAVVSVLGGGYTFYDTPMLRGGPMSIGRGMPYPGWNQAPGLPSHWKYLYLDRPLYKPGDTVKLFGVLAPRDPGATAIDQISATILRREYRWLGFGLEPPPLASTKLPITGGAFDGQISLPNLTPGYYELQLRTGGEHIISRWFEVEAYTKPAYHLTATADRKAVFAGEPINFAVQAAFFEGTPLPNLALIQQISWGNRGENAVTTGANGTVTTSFTPGVLEQGDHYGGPSHLSLYVRASLPEVGEISAGTSVQVFTRNVTVRPSVDVTEGAATIKAQVNHVTLDQLNSGDGWDYHGAPAAGRRVDGTLIEQNWVRVEEGEYYDFIAKQVFKQYHYRQDFREVGHFSAVTDAQGQIAHTVSIDPTKSYQVRLSVADTNGRAVRQDWGFNGEQYKFQGRGGYGPYTYYQLAPLDPEQRSWGIGEEVALRLLQNDEPIANRQGGFLFYQARLGLGAHTIQQSGTYRFNFAATDLPNTTVRGVYFDGRQYREAGEFSVRFDAQLRELNVTVTPDKSSYRPGEKVNLMVAVTDASGRPVQAHVNLNLVDEALLALRDQQANILAELYGEHIPSGILRTRQTHATSMDLAEGAMRSAAPAAVPMPSSAAKLMADDAGAVRREFRDTAYFGTVFTGADGKATTSFTLPDNLTTWRITFQAFAPDQIGATTGTAPLPVKIPFFVDTVLGDRYLTGDEPIITVRSFGVELTDGQPVDYQVSLSGPGGVQAWSVGGRAFTATAVALGRLQAGDYTLQVRGQIPGGHQDTMALKFAVIDSYLSQRKVDFHLLGAAPFVTSLEKDGMVSLVFTDHQRGRYLQLLSQLRWHGGSRLEQQLSRAVATDLLQTYFGEADHYPAPEWSPQGFQTPDGSIAILPYSDGDLYLSALVADLAPDRFDRGALTEYFYLLLDERGVDRDRGTTALYGLAALGEPVLQAVRAQLKALDLTPAEQLRLGLALAALGDLEGARPVYQQLMRQHGEQLGSNTRLTIGRDTDEILTATAQAAALGARLGEPQTPALLGYLLANPTSDVLLLLEQLLVARAALPLLPAEPATFSYVDNGETKVVALAPGQSIYWSVTSAQVNSLRLTAQSGEVGLTVAYQAPLSAAELQQAPGYAVARTYEVEGKGAATSWQQGDLVRVILTYEIPPTAPGGGFELTDYLPSGLRLVQRPWQHGVPYRLDRGPAWPMAVDGQQVTFWVGQKGEPLYYYARVIAAGSYTAEQPVLQHQQSGRMYGHGERAQVQIIP